MPKTYWDWLAYILLLVGAVVMTVHGANDSLPHLNPSEHPIMTSGAWDFFPLPLLLAAGFIMVFRAVKAGRETIRDSSGRKEESRDASPQVEARETDRTEIKAGSSIEKQLARAYVLKDLIPKMESAAHSEEQAFHDWLAFSSQRIWGEGLSSGNHRTYRQRHDKWLSCVDDIKRIFQSGLEDFRNTNLPVKVNPGDVILKNTPNDENMWNVENSGPDQDRKLQHRVWHEERDRTRALIDQIIRETRGELFRIEQAIKEVGQMPD